jgi:hypothetical protein
VRTLRTNGQRAVLGAVLFPPTTNLLEAGLQFVGLDAFPREAIAGWFDTVRPMVGVPPSVQVFYMPTFEQRDVALANTAWFAERGIPVSSAARWVIADEIYAAGWALGRLIFVPGNEIGAAYRDGRLKHDDILLTDAIPAEVPPLAGIVTLSPATPNSHAVLLAKSFGIPFVHVAQPGFPEKMMSWIGRDVLLRAIDLFEERQVAVVPMAPGLSPALRAEIAALKVPLRLNLPPKTAAGSISLGTIPVGPVFVIPRKRGNEASFARCARCSRVSTMTTPILNGSVMAWTKQKWAWLSWCITQPRTRTNWPTVWPRWKSGTIPAAVGRSTPA